MGFPSVIKKRHSPENRAQLIQSDLDTGSRKCVGLATSFQPQAYQEIISLWIFGENGRGEVSWFLKCNPNIDAARYNLSSVYIWRSLRARNALVLRLLDSRRRGLWVRRPVRAVNPPPHFPTTPSRNNTATTTTKQDDDNYNNNNKHQ